MYIVHRQILKVVDNWSIISTAVATLYRSQWSCLGTDKSGRVHIPLFCMLNHGNTEALWVPARLAGGERFECRLPECKETTSARQVPTSPRGALKVPGQSLPNVRVEIRPIPCCHVPTGLLQILLLTENPAVCTIIKIRTPWNVGTLWHVRIVKLVKKCLIS